MKDRFFLISILMVFICNSSYAQKFMQIELFNDPTTIKFYQGDKVSVKTKHHGNDWVTLKIEEIIPDDKVLVYPQGYLHIDEITHIRVYKNFAKYMSLMVPVTSRTSPSNCNLVVVVALTLSYLSNVGTHH